MSDERRRVPWGTALFVLGTLAVLNAVFEPFASDRALEVPTALTTSDPGSRWVRHTDGWPRPRDAAITPGVQTITDGGGQCTANFVFTDSAGEVYLGQAAHCAGKGRKADGCKARTKPLGSRVRFAVGTTIFGSGKTLGVGRLAYSSWQSMQERGVTKSQLCAYNDFALVRVSAQDRDRVNPTMPFWGGPTGLATGGVVTGQRFYAFGRSSWRTEASKASRQAAVALTSSSGVDSWSHTVASLSPGVPGDSGSGYVDSEGYAIGTLSTLGIGSQLLVNGVSDLAHQLAYARRHSGLKGLRLEVGTRPFNKERAERAQQR